MLRIVTKIVRKFSFNYKIPPSLNDLANMGGYLNIPSTPPSLTFWEKLAHFSPSSMYESVDLFSREFLFTLANDYRLGLPAAVILISLMLRGLFFYPMIRGQISALKMQIIKPFLNRYQQKMKLAQMTKNKALMKSAREQFKEEQKKRGIDNFYALVNFFQIPLLITWFFSLRYIAAMPEIYPSVTQSFLWMDDLSTYDPYFILPIVSALFTSYSIAVSPAMKSGTIHPLFEPFAKYLKFMPILALPFVSTFPAIINLYWCTAAFSQAMTMIVLNTDYVQDIVYHKKQTSSSKPQVLKAVFVQQQPNSNKHAQLTSQQKDKLKSFEQIKLLKFKPKTKKKKQNQ